MFQDVFLLGEKNVLFKDVIIEFFSNNLKA